MVFGGWGRRRRGPFGGGPYGEEPYGQDPYGPGPGYGGYPPGYRRGFGRRYAGGPFGGPMGGPAGGSCLRDACLLDLGCCAGEALTDNCLISAIMLFPAFVWGFVTGTARRRSLTGGLLAMIALYQRRISPRLRGRCRFSPSCSHYAVSALEQHGLRHGTWLTAKRLVRCRPGGPRGLDPVPTP